MRKRWLFVLALVAGLLMLFPTSALADDGFPPFQKPDYQGPVSLDELRQTYGLLRDREGPVGVVVELYGDPAAVVYAQAKKTLPHEQAVAKAAAQVETLAQRQVDFLNVMRAQHIAFTKLYSTQRVYNGIWMYVDAKDIGRLAALPNVKALHPIVTKKISNDTGVPMIGALEAWQGATGTEYQGEGIRVGVIDTGVDYLHADFGGPGTVDAYNQDFTTLGDEDGYFGEGAPKVVGGYDFAGDDYNGANAPNPDPDPMDCNGHGTHVAGTIAGFGVLRDTRTTYVEDPDSGDTYANLADLSRDDYIDKFYIGPGVAPKASLYALRVFGCSGGTNLVAEALEWAMDPNGDGDLSDHLDVVNMSLGADYGSVYDADTVAANNAAEAGIIVVAASGNSGDNFYITSSPGVAEKAISVASVTNTSKVMDAFEVVSAPTIAAGTYPAARAYFGPVEYDVTADLVYAEPNNGCAAITNDVDGKIALIDRGGGCYFSTKVYYAQQAGAVGVIVANSAGEAIPMGGAQYSDQITIPSVMVGSDMGDQLKNDLGSGTVNVHLSSDYYDTMVVDADGDNVSDFSSRGPARVVNLLKPDVAAPGQTVFSAAALTGNDGASFQGTSMATPHTAGAMALLREMHPDWSVMQLKALLMNSAEIYNEQLGSVAPSRVGAGRVDIQSASGLTTIAYNGENPDEVSVSFGPVFVSLDDTQVLTKPIVLHNFSDSDQTFDIDFESRYQNNDGLAFDVVDDTGAHLDTITVPANGEATVFVQATVTGEALQKAVDGNLDISSGRQYFSEGGGYVLFTESGGGAGPHVPVYIAPRPTSTMHVDENSLTLGVDGTAKIHLVGEPVDNARGWAPLGMMFNLVNTSRDNSYTSGPANAGDLQYVGVSYTPADPDNGYPGVLAFGLATYGNWSSPSPWDTEFDIYIDTDEDGTTDYLILNFMWDDQSFPLVCDLSTDEILCDVADYVTNLFDGQTDTALFNNRVMVLAIDPADIGLDENNTDFDFFIVAWNRESPVGWADLIPDFEPVVHYDVAQEAFETGLFWDIPGEEAVPYNADVIASQGSEGLLLFHFHNNPAGAAEVVPVGKWEATRLLSIYRLDDDPTTLDSVVYRAWFSGPVSGVDASAFELGVLGRDMDTAAITKVEPLGPGLYQVTVSTGGADANGYLTLRFSDTAAVTDADGNPVDVSGVETTYRVKKTPIFSDVPFDYWANEYIETIYHAGITSGYVADNTYRPGNSVTRAQMAKFLLKAIHGADYEPPDVEHSRFSDVADDYWAKNWIEELAEEGITGGYPDGTYRPNNPVTRAQMAKFLLVAIHGADYEPPAAGSSQFSDVPDDYWAKDWIEELVAEGIAGGYPDGTYRPGNNVTRAQMAKFLVNAFGLPHLP